METKDIDIAAILKDKPRGIQLFDLLHCVKVKLDRIEFVKNKEQETVIWCNILNSNKITLFRYSYTGTELGWLNGLQILKPSSEMQDWSKFVWRKGDVLQYKNGGGGAIFMGWSDDSYTHFESSFFRDWRGVGIGKKMLAFKTEDFEKADESTVNFIIDGINEYSDGKFNLSTLTIERLGSQFKDGDIVRQGVLNGTNIYIIKTCIDKIDNKYDYYARYNTQDKEVNYNDWSHISPTARLATESEKQQLFDALEKEGKRWNPETKTLEDLPKKCEFKAFDKVLVRNYDSWRWRINLFSHYEKDTQFKYACLSGNFLQCIPYNEQTKHLLGTTDEYKGGEG